MARQKKEEPAELNISLEQFTRTRDSVIMSLSNLQKGLAHVQNGLNDMMNAYIKHTASVLAGEDGAIESLQLPDGVLEMANAANFAVNNVANAVSAVPVAAEADTGKGKKRKRGEKKVKDPNQPKRPLTAAFLYAQSARPIVRKDLENELESGAKLEPNAINLEVNKRWNEMATEEKETWRASYRESMEQYVKDMAAYKASLGVAAADEVEAAAVEEGSEAEGEIGPIDTEMESSDDEDEPTPVKAATPPPATNGKTSRKRQKTTAAPQVNGANAAVTGQTPVPLPSKSAPAAAAEATPAKKERKKKEKAIAPAPTKEASPDDTKKKTTKRATRNAEVEGEEKVTKKRERSKRKSEGATA